MSINQFNNKNYLNQIFYQSSTQMSQLPDSSIDLIITSPPYFTATFPLEMPNRLIRLYSFVGDTVLDPFAGAGTTLCSAQQLARNFVGYELYQHYQPLIQQRLGIE